MFPNTTIERLIKDPTAKGIRRANYTKSLGEGKQWVIKPQSEWIEHPCPAIVSEEMWNECNAILEGQHKKRSKVGPRAVHLLAGFVHCSCGSKMYVYTETPVYKCKQCKRKIAVLDIDDIYHEQLKQFLLTDDDVETAPHKADSLIQEKEILLKAMRTEYTALQKKLELHIDMRGSGELSKDDFAVFYAPVQTRIRQIEAEIPELEAGIDFLKIHALSTNTVIQCSNLKSRNVWIIKAIPQFLNSPKCRFHFAKRKEKFII